MEMRKLFNNTMKRTLCICMAWLGLGLAVQAQTATLTTQAASIAQGREATLDVTLAGGVEISGGQFTVTLPQGITIKDVMLNEERSTNHTLEYRLEGSNSAKILFYAQPTAPLKGNEGTLCTLSLEATSDIARGEYEVSFSDIRLAVDATTTAEVNAVEGSLKVIPCYTIKVEATEGGSVEGGGVFVEGDMVTLKAIPEEGYHFVQWSDGSTDTPYVFEAKDNVTLTAQFAPNAYNLIYVIDGVEYRRESVLYKSKVEGIEVEAREGYTFSGWIGLPATMPANDVTVNGSFITNKYLVTFKIGDVVVSSKSLEYGTEIVAPEAPEKEGYTFNGWGEVAATVPAGDVTYEGSYSVNSYTLTYVVDGEKYWEETVAYGTALTAPNAPAKEGYTFSGWIGLPDTMPAKDVTIVGSFVTNGYTLTYVVDGEVYKTLVYEYGSAVVAEPEPVKEGYTFSGWIGLPTTMPANDVTISGTFTINKYLVTFKIGDEVIFSESLEYGAPIVAPKAPEREGYTFEGWGEVAETVPAGDVTYEGSYSVNSYTLTYVVDGTIVQTSSVAYGTEIILLDEPVKEGYTFSGWSEAPKTMPASDVTISGTFTINKYTVTFYDWDGTVLKTETVKWGQAATAPADPTHEGYTFTGWNKAFTNVRSNLEVHAVYTEIGVLEYIVTFCDWDGAVLKTQIVKQGQDATAPADPTREGYTFAGWDKAFANVQSDLNVCAVYTQNIPQEYTITFNAGANGWIEGTAWHDQAQKVVGYTSPLYRAQQGKVEKLRITVNHTQGNTKYFCLSELQFFDADGQPITLTASNITSNANHNALNPNALDGGGFAALFDGQTGSYFHSAWKNMPAEDHYLEVTLPNGGYDAFSFKMLSRTQSIENGFVYDQSHTFPGVMVMTTSVELVATDAPEPNPNPMPELDNDAVYYITQPYNGGTSWAIAEGGSAMNINTKLGITADGADMCQQFAFISNDGGATHYLYHPAEKKYVNKDNTLSTTPRDAVYFMAGAYENTFVVYFDNDHVINTNSTDGLIINRWGPLSGWGMADGGNSCSITRVEKTEPDPQPELNNETLYYVSQPYRGATSWAIAKGGAALQCNGELGLVADKNDTRQQFAFISNDGGMTRYLFHPAERKYVNMDGSLSDTPQDPVFFMDGAYENTFVVYFDIYHFINVNENPMLVINQWGPADNGWRGTADGGNSCLITPIGKFDISDAINFVTVDGSQRVQKVLENGTWYIILPDGSKYTMTGVRVK